MKKVNKQFEISIPEIGSAVGTLGWLSPLLEDMQKSLKISNTEGLPCLMFQHPNEHKWCIIAMPFIDDDPYKNIDGIATMRAVENRFEYGIFKYLTPAAEEVCNQWIEKIVELFKAQLQAS